MTLESAQGSVVIVLFALAASLLIGGLLRFIWGYSEQRTIEKKWQERERLLDSRRPVAVSPEIFEWSPRPASPRDVARAEPAARVLYIVARDQPELFAFLRRDFAAEEAEAVIEILVDRRQGARQCEADGRDPRRNGSVSMDLREMGFTFVRQHAPAGSRSPLRGVGARAPSEDSALGASAVGGTR